MEILDRKYCTGCSACKNICPKNAITMIEGKDGFKYPNIDEKKCINCSLCKKVCSVLNKKEEEKTLPEAYACINKNENIRKKSSSGGVFSLIANNILKQNGVVFGASFNSDLKLEHIQVQKEEDLELLRGSKYLQSDINETFKETEKFLKEGKKVLYTGTPCQIEGLKSYLRKDYENLYLQDLICHGVPSKKVFEKYIKEKELDLSEKIDKISFRDKENEGWNNYQLLIETRNFKKYINHEEDIFMKIFLNDISLRKSCYNCNFKKKHRISDITLADFWGINEVAKEMNDEKGTSLVLVNSDKGKNLFDEIKNEMIFKKVDFMR